MSGILHTTLLITAFASLAACLVGLAMHWHKAWRVSLILCLLSFCVLGLNPNQDDEGNWRYNLKAGLDLSGGTSLLYEIDTTGVANPRNAVQQTIDVLKRRVDPQGVRNLNWREEQGNRLEIQMPLPSQEVQEAKDALVVLETRITEANITEAEVVNAIGFDGDEFTRAVATLERGIPQRTELIGTLKEAHAVLEQASATLKAAGDEPDVDALQQHLAAKNAYQTQLNAVLATNLNISELRSVMSRPTEIGKDETQSPYDRGVAKLKANHPLLGDQLAEYQTVYAAYNEVKGDLDDPDDLIRMLKGAGVLEFRITSRAGEVDVESMRRQLAELGPGAFEKMTHKWIAIDNPAQFVNKASELRDLEDNPVGFLDSRGYVGGVYAGTPYVLCHNTETMAMADRFAAVQGDWGLSGAGPSQDDFGGLAVSFNLNPVGGRLMRQLTADNVGRQMAIILDDALISAPSIQEPLGRGVRVTGGAGGFSAEETQYMVNTLNAGSLKAKLSPEPIAIRTIGSNLGADNLAKGLEAARDALIVVIIFMIIYYLLAGAVANVALLANVVIILGIMSLYRASFTLPGIAGIVLTIGMCVDANVLIFERIREEMKKGTDFETCLRLGYQRAFSSIVDSNITNLIVCFILYYTATVEIRGFAMTLGIGICATLFTALFMTRVIFMIWHAIAPMSRLSMLPTLVPAVDRLLHPNVRWLAKKPLFFVFSAVLLAGSLVMVTSVGEEILDIEFRAGTEVEFNLAEDQSLTLEQARQRVRDIAVAVETDTQLQQRMEERVNEIVSDLKDKATNADQLDTFDEAAVRAEAVRTTDLTRLDGATLVSVGSAQGEVEEEGRTVPTYGGFSVVSTVEDSRIVSAAIKQAFGDVLDASARATISFTGRGVESRDQAPVYPILSDTLGESINREADNNMAVYRGGVAIVLDNLQPASTLDEIQSRIAAMRLQPDFENIAFPAYKVIGLTAAPGRPSEYTTAVVVSREPTISILDDTESWNNFASDEWKLVSAALSRDRSLSKVSNFSPTVAQTLKQQAIVAVVFSLLAIVVYIWFRFGSLRYGLAAIAALTHDVIIALGAVAATHYLFDISLGQSLLIGQFKLNLGLIAALLTIIGYSLNDTIVLFDRIRENRGKLAHATGAIIDTSINQTISRTLLTSVTTLLAVGTLYVFGGDGVRGFAFALIIGVFVGTYSSIAVASPLLALGMRNGGSRPLDTEEDTAPTTAPAA